MMTSTSTDGLAHPVQAQRLASLKQLMMETTRRQRVGTNVHLHSNHSFSVFRSPTEVVWAGEMAGIEVIGINDFFTVAGFEEFAAACKIVGLPPVFGVECIAMDRTMESAKQLANDPANPGKIYLCGKGVSNPAHPQANATLSRLRGHQEARNRQLIARADAHFQALAKQAGPTWEEVAQQTPGGNTTERHVAKAILKRIIDLGGRHPAQLYQQLVGVPPKAGDQLKPTDADAQNQIRSSLLKVGKPCYEAEDPAGFPTVEELRQLFLQLGAIPTYPVLGNPVTDGEKDIRSWCDQLESWGWRALELIPARNTDDRVAAVVQEAIRRGWPVFDGTEHNTPAMEPITTKWGMDERFRLRFREGALLLVGHQALRAAGRPGYVDEAGNPVPGGFQACVAEGQRVTTSAW